MAYIYHWADKNNVFGSVNGKRLKIAILDRLSKSASYKKYIMTAYL